MRETHKHQRQPNHQTILLGDLNSSWIDSDKRGTHPALHPWANHTIAGRTLDECLLTKTLKHASAPTRPSSPRSRG